MSKGNSRNIQEWTTSTLLQSNNTSFRKETLQMKVLLKEKRNQQEQKIKIVTLNHK
jgi:hypothetical protein